MNAKKTTASTGFPGPANPPHFAELPPDQLYVSPAAWRQAAHAFLDARGFAPGSPFRTVRRQHKLPP